MVLVIYKIILFINKLLKALSLVIFIVLIFVLETSKNIILLIIDVKNTSNKILLVSFSPLYYWSILPYIHIFLPLA